MDMSERVPAEGGRVIHFPMRGGREPWLSKRELANHLHFSTRWVEYRVREGMPSQRMGGRLRFRLSEVESWLAQRRSA